MAQPGSPNWDYDDANPANATNTNSTSVGTTSGTNPYTGFASRYPSSGTLKQIYDSPWAIIPDVYKGINTSGAGYNSLRDLGADPLTLFTIMNSGNRAGAGFGANEGDYANFLNNLYRNVGGGGRGFSASELTSNLFRADDESALGQLLTAGDSNQQMRTVFNMLRDIANVSMNPLAGRAFQSYAQKSGDEALNEIINDRASGGKGAANMNMSELLRQIAPQLMVGER